MTFANDTFTAANGTTIQSRASDSGHTWVFGSGANYAIESDRAYPQQASSGTGAYYLDVTPPSADYEVSTIIRCMTDNNSGALGVTARYQDINNLYLLWYNTNGDQVHLIRRASSVNTTIGGPYTVTALTAGTELTLALRCEGDQITAVINGIAQTAVTDTTISLAGKPGLRHTGIHTSTTGLHLDDFTASVLTASAAANAGLAGLGHGHGLGLGL